MSRPKQDVNIMSLAKEAGTSHMTVSRVLNNRAGVSERMRAKILALQKKYNYKTNYASPSRDIIAVAVPSGGVSDYQSRLLKGIMDYNKEGRFEVALVVGGDFSDPLQNLRDLQCAGLILPTGGLFASLPEELDKFNMPVILLDAQTDCPNIGWIDNDSFGGSLELAKHLIELGHRKILYFMHGREQKANHTARLEGYREALRQAEIDANPDWIMAVNEVKDETGLTHWENLPIALRRLLKRSPGATAIMSVDDGLALRTMKVLRDEGLHIPQDISVVGFDNQSESSLWNPELTTVNHPLEEEGFLAAKAMAFALDHPGDWQLPRRCLPTKLVPRNSATAKRKES